MELQKHILKAKRQRDGNMPKLDEYLVGKTEPKNEYAKHIIASMKIFLAEREQVEKELQTGRNVVNMLMTKKIQLEAILSQYQKDLEVFDHE